MLSLRHLFAEGQPWPWFVWGALFGVLSLLRVVPSTDWLLGPLSGLLLLLALTLGVAPRQSWSSPWNWLGWLGLVLAALIGASVYTVTRLSDAAWTAFSLTGMVWWFAVGSWLLLRRPKPRAA